MSGEKSQALEKFETQSMELLKETKGLAQVFVQSGLFEDVKDASQAFVKILKGRELGLQPVAAMNAFDIIQKRLYVRGQTCVALVNACPYAGFTPKLVSAEKCVITFHRRTAEGWVDFPDVEYGIDIAKARGLTSRSPEWKTDPANMLYWRCISRGTARYFAELTAGLPTVDDAIPPVSDEKASESIADVWGDTRAEPEEKTQQEPSGGAREPKLWLDPGTGEELDDIPDPAFDPEESAKLEREDREAQA